MADNGKGIEVPTSFEAKHVLVADDELLVAQGIAASVRELGHEVSGIARDGEEAVEMARQQLPDIALLDIQMPKISGTEVALLLCEEMGIPSLIISAYSDQEIISKINGYAASSGVYGYLLKPVESDALRVALAVAFQRAAVDRAKGDRINQLERNLVNRRVVERAKWKLVEQHRLSEPEAHDKLQKMARDRRIPLVQLAEAVIDGRLEVV